MKENKNNELQKDSLEQVAGGGPEFDPDVLSSSAKEAQAVVEKALQKLELAKVTPSGPDRQAIFREVVKLQKKATDLWGVVEQQLQARGQMIDQIAKSL